jgi:hypothetical protein
MKDYQVSTHNLDAFIDELQDELSKNKLMIITTQQARTGKWGMARLWRKWMATTASFMAKNGAKMPLMLSVSGENYGSRAFNSDDAHELFTSHHLGLDEKGYRLSWSKSGSDDSRAATKGERFDALRKHENWCVEKGIRLFKPRDCEYELLSKDQSS